MILETRRDFLKNLGLGVLSLSMMRYMKPQIDYRSILQNKIESGAFSISRLYIGARALIDSGKAQEIECEWRSENANKYIFASDTPRKFTSNSRSLIVKVKYKNQIETLAVFYPSKSNNLWHLELPSQEVCQFLLSV
jgi:hypothetical protein